jgi:hypothetical protein
MEYMYADNPNPEVYTTNEVGYNKIVNGFRNNDVQAYNLNDDYSLTQNTAAVSVVQVSDSRFVTLNQNLIVPYNDYTSQLTPSSESAVVFPSNLSITYDSVRYWILAGYNLSNIDGVIIQIQAQDQDQSYVTLSQVLLQRGSSDAYAFSPSPLSIGSSIYDKYFEISIPSVAAMMDSYQAAPDGFKSSQLASLISKSGTGFVINSPLRITAYQVGSIQNVDGYENYLTQTINTLSLEAEDPFSEVAAYIAPSVGGQFFEYFATYDGGFIEDFILFQNSIGNAYVISHQIEVLEQIGAALIETSNFTSLQTTGYDVPNLYRPIVRNASVAVSFTLRYTMTLVNNANQQRVVRVSSYTSLDPHSYGTSIQPISLSNSPQVQKIYNKVFTPPAIQLSSDVFSSQTRAREVIRLNNVFVDNTNVNLGITNLSINNTTLGQDPSGSENGQTVLFYGKGKSEIDISPFDNFYKFTVVTNPSGNSPKAFNFDTGGSYYLQFIDNNGKKLSVPNLTNTNIANPSKGELAFKIDETYSTKILQFVDRTFYITNRPPKSDEEAQLSDITVATNSSIQDVRATTSISNNLPLNSIFGIGASSVVYWGYWKPEKEESRFIGATGATASTGTPRTNTNVVRGGTVGPTPAAQPDGVNLLTNVKPIAGPTGTFRRFGIPVPRIDQINLTLDEKINAVSSAVQGFVDQGWTTTRIISYFLKPNEVGYKLFQLSKDQFKQAVVGIFSDADLVLIDNFGNTQSGLTNGGPASTKGRVTQTGGGNIGSDISNRVTRGGRQL